MNVKLTSRIMQSVLLVKIKMKKNVTFLSKDDCLVIYQLISLYHLKLKWSLHLSM